MQRENIFPLIKGRPYVSKIQLVLVRNKILDGFFTVFFLVSNCLVNIFWYETHFFLDRHWLNFFPIKTKSLYDWTLNWKRHFISFWSKNFCIWSHGTKRVIKLNVITSIHSRNQEVLEYPRKYASILHAQKLYRVRPANSAGLYYLVLVQFDLVDTYFYLR